jgi:hypothetical protein
MLSVYLTSASEAIEVVVASGLVAIALAAFVAIPFAVMLFVEERRESAE